MAVLANSTLKLLLFWLIWVQPGFLTELDETQLQDGGASRTGLARILHGGASKERTSRFVWVSRNGPAGTMLSIADVLAGSMNEIIRLQSMVLGIHAAGLARVVFAMQIRLQAAGRILWGHACRMFVPEHDPLGPGCNQLSQLQVPLGSS